MTEIAVKSSDGSKIRSLDIFFFEDDEMGRLDAYQRFEQLSSSTVSAASRSGNKVMVVLANASCGPFGWAQVNSYESLRSVYMELKDETAQYPVMKGECRLSAGYGRSCTVSLEPLLVKVVIRSLQCDFSGKTYAGAKLTDVKAYLTNVNCRYPIIDDPERNAESFINVGKNEAEDYEDFLSPDFIFTTVPGDWGAKKTTVGKALYCYPNTGQVEGAGSPFTRLVIEGKIGGDTYYYPLNVGRLNSNMGGGIQPGQTEGVGRNRSYVYDIKITKRGATDPDTTVESGTISTVMSIIDYRDGGEDVISY